MYNYVIMRPMQLYWLYRLEECTIELCNLGDMEGLYMEGLLPEDDE